jgi:hypothetical protein
MTAPKPTGGALLAPLFIRTFIANLSAFDARRPRNGKTLALLGSCHSGTEGAMDLRKPDYQIDDVQDDELRAHGEQALVVVVLSTATIVACTALLVSLH